MTDDSLTLAGEVNVLRLHDEVQTLVYIPLPFPVSRRPRSLSLPPSLPPPRGNMAFEVNTICFVAFL